MEIVSASKARANLFSLVEQVNQKHQPMEITSRKGNAVLLSKADWDSLQKTLYLQSAPEFVQSVRAAEQADDGVSEETFSQTQSLRASL